MIWRKRLMAKESNKQWRSISFRRKNKGQRWRRRSNSTKEASLAKGQVGVVSVSSGLKDRVKSFQTSLRNNQWTGRLKIISSMIILRVQNARVPNSRTRSKPLLVLRSRIRNISASLMPSRNLKIPTTLNLSIAILSWKKIFIEFKTLSHSAKSISWRISQWMPMTLLSHWSSIACLTKEKREEGKF